MSWLISFSRDENFFGKMKLLLWGDASFTEMRSIFYAKKSI